MFHKILNLTFIDVRQITGQDKESFVPVLLESGKDGTIGPEPKKGVSDHLKTINVIGGVISLGYIDFDT